HHAAGRGHAGRADLAALLPVAARAGAVVADAVAVHPGPARAAGGRVRHHLGARLGLHRAGRVRHLLGDVLADHARHRARHLLDDGVGHLAADRVGHAVADRLTHRRGAGHLLADRLAPPDLAGAHLVGGAAGHADQPAGLLVGLAGAGVEAALAAGPLPL